MTESASRSLREILGVSSVTDEDVALFRDFNIIRRPTKTERVDTAIANGEAIRCPECQFVSWNPNDVRELYCGHCHGHTSRSDWHLIKELTRTQEPPRVLPPVRVNLAATLPETPPDQPVDS